MDDKTKKNYKKPVVEKLVLLQKNSILTGSPKPTEAEEVPDMEEGWSFGW